MKSVKLIVKGNVNGITDDNGLRALNEYYESSIMEFDKETSEYQMLKELCDLFENDYKHVFQPVCSLEFLN